MVRDDEVQEKKAKQLEEWPEPTDAAAWISFLCLCQLFAGVHEPRSGVRSKVVSATLSGEGV